MRRETDRVEDASASPPPQNRAAQGI